jgi:hypothetical protein
MAHSVKYFVTVMVTYEIPATSPKAAIRMARDRVELSRTGLIVEEARVIEAAGSGTPLAARFRLGRSARAQIAQSPATRDALLKVLPSDYRPEPESLPAFEIGGDELLPAAPQPSAFPFV